MCIFTMLVNTPALRAYLKKPASTRPANPVRIFGNLFFGEVQLVARGNPLLQDYLAILAH